MGYNATIVVNLDALDRIRDDLDFGKKFAEAVLNKAVENPLSGEPEWFSAGLGDAGAVIEVHDADQKVVVEVSRNMGKVIRPSNP